MQRCRAVGYVSYTPEADPARGRQANRAVYEGMADAVCAGVRDVLAELVEVERGMEAVAELLRVSQPFLSGRLMVRFWRRSGEARRPILVRAVRAGFREGYEPVDRRARSRRDGAWGEGADRVDLALRVWWQLVDRREVLMKRLYGCQRALRGGGAAGEDWRYGLTELELAMESIGGAGDGGGGG